MPRARQRLGKYRIERRISTGPRATVYKAYDPIHGVRVALKLANPAIKDKEFLDEFRRDFSFDGEHVAESFFEEVGPPQFGVGLGDPVELLTLPSVEIVRVFPQGVTRSGDLSGVAGGSSPTAR